MISYIINGEIEFRPEENKLISLVNSDLSTTLTTPSSKCLSLLLENAPQLVSHEELLNRIWGDNGMLVPLNTLHQNISIIRRGFKQVHSTDDKIIKNIPGQGFKISSKVDAVEMNDSSQTASVQNLDMTNDEICSVLNNKFLHIKKWRLLLLFFVICLSVGIAVIYSSINRGELDVYRDYKVHLTKNGCHVYSNARVKYDFDKVTEIQSKLQKMDLFCEDYPWVYISTYKASSVSSAITCKKEIKTKIKDNCISFYFREGIEK
ncbi:winged helix-turn-helix domain-containing protein [Citrobacter amalonaticus]|uniref:winged helix-turn-helix domain-containing protein n=1 Tax=Citrobacter amalonaticus TaxID=35703 RepID=UPI00207C4D54|nr:winged helix-turn-helix domain-containing protein [Citrobacter amalonaticus]MCO4157698.1 winged helix-turn-helix domain-containing protein [Citrobacter amalonaticus]